MSGISINNQNRQEQFKRAALTGAAAFAIGAAVNGAAEAINQKRILSNPDSLNIAKANAAIKEQNCTIKNLGTKEMVDIVKNNIKDSLHKAENFIKNGKMDFKSIAKKGAIGGLLTAAAVGITHAVRAIYKNEKADNAKILANELAKVNSETTATINIEYADSKVSDKEDSEAIDAKFREIPNEEEVVTREDIDPETIADVIDVVADILEEEADAKDAE